MTTPLRVLVLEERSADAEMMIAELRRSAFDVEWERAETENEYLAGLERAPDLILADYRLPQFDGMKALDIAVRQGRDTPFILVAGTLGEELAAEAIRRGASDYLLKDRLTRLGQAVKQALEQKRLRIQTRRAIEALQLSEERFRRLAENAPDAIFRYRLVASPGFEYASPAALAITGYAPEEYYADPQLHQRLVPPEDRRVLDGILKENSPRSELTSMRLIRKDGSIIWVEPGITVLRNEEGAPIALEAIVRDISERKRAEEALRASESRFRAVTQSANDAIITTDSAGNIVGWNHGAELMFGHTEAEIIGQPVAQMVSEEDRNRYVVGMERVQGAEEANIIGRTSEGEGVRKDGRKFPLEVSLSEWETEQGRFHTAIVRDISIRKRSEDELRQQLAGLVAIQRVSAAMRTAQTLDEMLPRLLDETLVALNAEGGEIWLCNQARDELRVAVTRAWFGQLDQAPIRPGEGIAGTVFASGQAHFSAEFARDPLGQVAGRMAIPPGWGGACVPIRTGSETLGVLFVAVPLPREVSSGQMNLLVSLAEMAGAAVARMRVHEETVKHLEKLQALHTVDLGIAGSLDLRVTLSILLEQVISQLRVDAADVLLLREPMNVLEYTAGRGFRTREIEHTRLRVGESFAGRAAQGRSAVQVTGPAMVRDDRRFSPLWAKEEFSAYVGVPLIAKGQVKGVLEVFQRAQPAGWDAERAPGSEWFDFLETLSAQAAVALDNTQLFDELQRSNTDLSLAYDATIEGWSRAMDLRDKETEGHTLRVTEMTERLAKQMGISETEIMHMRRGALLHDIGKMGVPDGILLKPGKLTDEEWEAMRKHPQLAYDMLSSITYLHPALDIPHCHHEKWDGTGYPQGLKGEQIPLAARVFAVVDVWDALTSDRPYRQAWTKEEALAHIREQSGKHFDPHVVEQFLPLVTGV
ncbi:MAG: PAS domain S-box protein [Anaerolineales bacterium]